MNRSASVAHINQKDPDADQGRKFDTGKTDFSLLPLEPIEQVAKVMTFGAAKYERDNWQLLKDGKNRYFAACLRHLWAWAKGEYQDPESGLPHLAHAACCVLFLLHISKEPE